MMDTVNRLRTDARLAGVELFEALVDAWEFIVAENKEQLHLVSDSDARSWERAFMAINSKLEAVGSAFTYRGVWDEVQLGELRGVLNACTHKSAEELQPRVEVASSELVEGRRASWLLERLNKLR